MYQHTTPDHRGPQSTITGTTRYITKMGWRTARAREARANPTTTLICASRVSPPCRCFPLRSLFIFVVCSLFFVCHRRRYPPTARRLFVLCCCRRPAVVVGRIVLVHGPPSCSGLVYWCFAPRGGRALYAGGWPPRGTDDPSYNDGH